MSRLIDECELLKEIDGLIKEFEWGTGGIIRDVLVCTRDVVVDQPTAYDVEAVVRELEKISNGCGEIPLEDAIEIVRGGRNV